MEGSPNQQYVCIHGHFYQPPRENAWLEIIEQQDSAAPFHDWNERINFECYAPNTSARLLDTHNAIVDIRSNYSRMSFNFGPTLLSWLQGADEATYQAIIEADKRSLDRFGGHGSALAQVYNHMIMPLANERDQQTQVIWGIRDFEYRFGRKPEGMWLAETAVDTPTLEVLAEQGIRYTILAPRQGKAVRPLNDKEWTQLPPDSIDPRRPYLCKLPSGKSIVLFFYHGGIAQGVAFQGLLNNGEHFAQAFTSVFSESSEPQLAHIATDGESYGHHHRHGEMALAACLRSFEQQDEVVLTNYGQFLEWFPPTWEVQIHENSSWSCVHGVERWRSNCGCNTGGHAGWTQEWRKPLRDSLDWLRDVLIPVFEREAAPLLRDPWEARDDYIDLILNRNRQTVDVFLRKHAKKELTRSEKTKTLRLLEMQRFSMLMYTSCGWFFDEISGIETDQILQYACRVIHFAQQTAGLNLQEEFIERLKKAPSNIHPNGAWSYINHILPNQVNLTGMAMHYAASSLFEEHPEQLDVFNYRADSEVLHRLQAGIQKLVIGRTTVRSKTTFSEKQFSFAVLYLGQQNLIGNISIDMKRAEFDHMATQLSDVFKNANLGKVIGLMQEFFGSNKFTLAQLFQEEKRSFLRDISQKSLQGIEYEFREIYNENYQLMTSHQHSGIPVPAPFLSAVQFILNHDLHHFFTTEQWSIQELKRLLSEFKKWGVPVEDESGLALAAGDRLYRELQAVLAIGIPDSLKKILQLQSILQSLQLMNIDIDFWKVQNLYYSMRRNYQKLMPEMKDPQWEEAFLELGKMLGFQSITQR